MKNEITITLPYYNQPEMLKKQLEIWADYSADVAERVKVIIVDDGSPDYPALDVLKFRALTSPFSISLYRIKENIPWNHGGARNLAMTEARRWCIVTDMDHAITDEDMRKLLSMNLERTSYYMFNRKKVLADDSTEIYARHGDSFLLTKDAYWKVGGYNEEFSGYWNGVSQLFRHNLRERFRFVQLTDIFLILYGRDIISDASITQWSRRGGAYDLKNNPKLYSKFKKSLNNYKPVNPLRFNYEKLI